jgi:hypothetical protein
MIVSNQLLMIEQRLWLEVEALWVCHHLASIILEKKQLR